MTDAVRLSLARRSMERVKRHREAAAYHEGGHISAAWSRGMPFGAVTLAPPTLGCAGVATAGKHFTDAVHAEALSRAGLGLEIPFRIRRDFEATIMLLQAGTLAELRAIRDGEASSDPLIAEALERGELPVDLVAEKAAVESVAREVGRPLFRSDGDQIAELLGSLSAFHDDEASAYGAWLLERTRRLVDGEPFWTITRALAKALLAMETLTRTATRRVIRSALEPKAGELEFSNYVSEPANEGGNR